MKERLVQLLERERITPSRFADIIGVQRSSVSHIVSGRNNPSFDFLQKTLMAFPGLRAEWLLLGKGRMFENEGTGFTGTLFDQVTAPKPAGIRAEPVGGGNNEPGQDEDTGPGTRESTGIIHAPNTGKAIQVVVLYDDGTFRIYGHPAPG
ncbi:MAG: XRE family transcriptional regulator [Bacteroidetes bacterium]|nr:MAG: XRE family transcriptional regulator [Bacteroidota bacterium]